MGTIYFFICRCTFLLLFLAVTHGNIRCKTTKDCKNPEVDEFCDENFLACEPCSGYCSGAADALPLCMKNCPSKYSFLPPANKVCEGYVFTPDCQSFCSPPGSSMLGGTGNKQVVRILLECILFFQNLFAILSYSIMVLSHASMLFMNNRGKSVVGPGFPRGMTNPEVGQKPIFFGRFLPQTA